MAPAPVASGSGSRDVAPPVTVAQGPSATHRAVGNPGPAQVESHNAPSSSRSRQDTPPIAGPSTQVAPPSAAFSFESSLRLPQASSSAAPRRDPVAGPSSRPTSDTTTEEQSFATGSSRPRPVDPDVSDEGEAARPHKRARITQTRDDERQAEPETETEAPATEPVREEEANTVTTEAQDVPSSPAAAQVSPSTPRRANAESQTAAADSVDEKKADDPPTTPRTPRRALIAHSPSDNGDFTSDVLEPGTPGLARFLGLRTHGNYAGPGSSPLRLPVPGDSGNALNTRFPDVDEDDSTHSLPPYDGFLEFRRLNHEEPVKAKSQPVPEPLQPAPPESETDDSDENWLSSILNSDSEVENMNEAENQADEEKEEEQKEEEKEEEEEEGEGEEEEIDKKEKGKGKAKATEPEPTHKGNDTPSEKGKAKETEVAQEDNAQEVNAQEDNAQPTLRRSSRNKGKQRA